MATISMPTEQRGVVRINGGPDLLRATFAVTVEPPDPMAFAFARRYDFLPDLGEWTLTVQAGLWEVCGAMVAVRWLSRGNAVLLTGQAYVSDVDGILVHRSGEPAGYRATSRLVGTGGFTVTDLVARTVRSAA